MNKEGNAQLGILLIIGLIIIICLILILISQNKEKDILADQLNQLNTTYAIQIEKCKIETEFLESQNKELTTVLSNCIEEKQNITVEYSLVKERYENGKKAALGLLVYDLLLGLIFLFMGRSLDTYEEESKKTFIIFLLLALTLIIGLILYALNLVWWFW